MSYKSKKAKKIYHQRILKKIFFKFFLPFFILFILSIILLNSDFFKIKNIQVVGNKAVDEKIIKDIFNQNLVGKYFYLYSKNNFLFYPESKIENKILTKEDNLSKINISYNGLISSTINIKVEEKKPAYLLCNKEKEKKCFYLNEMGKVFEIKKNNKNKSKKDDKFLIFQKDFSVKPKSIFSEKDFTKLKTLIADIEALNLKIVRVEILKNNIFVLRTLSGAGLVIDFNQDFSKIPLSLKKISVKRDLKIDPKKKDFQKNISYINLIFRENIYYCLMGEKCQTNY